MLLLFLVKPDSSKPDIRMEAEDKPEESSKQEDNRHQKDADDCYYCIVFQARKTFKEDDGIIDQHLGDPVAEVVENHSHCLFS